MEILERTYVRGEEFYRMKICWWRISSVNPPDCMNIIEVHEIPLNVWHMDWELYQK